MNIRTLSTAAYFALAGCSLKIRPLAAHHARIGARRFLEMGGLHRSGDVVPNFVPSGIPNSPRSCGRGRAEPDLRAAAARVEASRYAVKVAAASLYPRIAMKDSASARV
jgi:hypothetical protein